MNEEHSFLAHFIEEDIYLIDEVASIKDTPPKPVAEKSKAIKESKVEKLAQEPVEKYEAISSNPGLNNDAVLSYRGVNTKKVLLLVDTISEDENTFLSKVLGAVQLTLQDCALVSLTENNTPQHQSLIENFEANIIIQFGGTPVNSLKEISPYKINFVVNKKALVTDDLKTIMDNVEKKKLLWGCLQQLFL